MRPEYVSNTWLEWFVEAALREDVGDGDHTTLSTIPNNSISKAKLLVKQEGILAGVELAQWIFAHIDASASFTIMIEDGTPVKPNEVAFIVEAKTQNILTAERLVLNCMQRMSGVATLTHTFAQAIQHTQAKLLDTRKTTPLFRPLEKWAVRLGGGHNHRFGLFDMILIKDNHIDYAGGVSKAIAYAEKYLSEKNKKMLIEVEARTLTEVEQALSTGKVHRILLDNMPLDMLRTAVQMISGKTETEASGGVTLDSIVAIAETGVDYISVGALTHSYPSLDLSLKAC